jgi:hypothetical protein
MIESSKYFNRLCYYNFYRRNKLLQRGKDICTGSGSKLSGRKAYRIKCQLYKMELPPFLLFTSDSVFVQAIISFPNYSWLIRILQLQFKNIAKKKKNSMGDALEIKYKSINKFILSTHRKTSILLIYFY